MNAIDQEFVKKTEAAYFRTNTDTGANWNAMFIWNVVRQHVGLPVLKPDDLPAFCETHQKYHVIKEDYGCVRRPVTES